MATKRDYVADILLANIRAKLGQQALMPVHDGRACGIYWYSTCVECLKLWNGTERQKEMPRELQSVLGFLKAKGKS